jgi:hypothetical protein
VNWKLESPPTLAGANLVSPFSIGNRKSTIGVCRADGGLVSAHLRAHNTRKSVQARSGDFILCLRPWARKVGRAGQRLTYPIGYYTL